ncbi:type IV secretion system protein [Bifidobacterium dentium]|uniref:type IV secretion system protein n=1 Tax=Bifidobacterium dentium TaxID=1689 RepID=UPI0013B89DE8|nr:type IV secretion system protein [Bifidobacterium dentium]NEG41168.1 type IV secretion system protein [Bifidobacterium dentium]
MFDFKDGLKSLLNQISQGMDPTISSLLTQTPAGKYPDAYQTVTNIATTAVKPVAMTVLAVVFSLEILHASQSIDQDGTQGVRTITKSLFKIIIVYMAAMNASWLCELITYLIQQIGTGVSRLITLPGTSSDAPKQLLGNALESSGALGQANLGQQLVAIIMLLIPFLISKLATQAVQILIIARFVELLILTAFGALPIAFLSYDGTKGWGEAYIREYASCAFSNITLLIGLAVYQPVANSMLTHNQDLMKMNLNQVVFDNWGQLITVSVLMVALVLISQKASKALFGQA